MIRLKNQNLIPFSAPDHLLFHICRDISTKQGADIPLFKLQYQTQIIDILRFIRSFGIQTAHSCTFASYRIPRLHIKHFRSMAAGQFCQLFCLCFFFHCFCKHQILHTISGHKNLLKTGHMIGIRMTDKPVRNL